MILISVGQVFSQNFAEETSLSSIHAQHITVTGHVVDKYDRDTVWYVNISVRNNKVRNDSIPVVSINESGYYSIHARPDDILVFSALGYNIQEIAIDGRTIIDVEMDCEDCGRYLPGKGQRQAAHDFTALAVYAFNGWGYGAEYAYLPQINNPYPFFNRIMRYADFNIRLQNVHYSDSEVRVFPHIRISSPFSIPLFSAHQKLAPFIGVGYYFDTNFKDILRHNWGVGGGLKTRLAFIDFKGQANRYMIINLMAGYTAYLGDQRKNHFYLGLRFYLSKPFVFE